MEDKKFKSTAVIKASNEAKRIYIWVNGEQKRDYFAVILFNLREINRSFEKLEAIEKVSMPDNPKITVSYEHLITLKKEGIVEYMPDGSKRRYNVRELLGTVYDESQLKKLENMLQEFTGKFDESHEVSWNDFLLLAETELYSSAPIVSQGSTAEQVKPINKGPLF